MIEKTILDYMRSALNVDVHMQRQEDPPDEYVIIEKTGSSKSNRIPTATVAFQSYSKTLLGAATLNESVKEAVENMPAALDEIGGVKLNSDYNFTDANAKQYRYQAVYVITHY